jgi:tRNA pseudouridine13 synthase
VEPARTSPRVPPAYATGDLPGIGGRSRACPEDFQVEELPAYEPEGRGEHLYLWVEKRGLATTAVAAALQRALEVPAAAVGFAGRKDAQALTRQWISVHTPRDPDPATLCGAGWRVLAASRHRNKLRAGHLRGNRFALVLRGVQAGPHGEALLGRLAAEGFPNAFGPQRLGEGLANALAGRAIVRSGRAPGGRSRQALERGRFAVNAYQAALFNALLERRLAELGDLATLLPGDLAVLHRNGAAFAVTEDALADAQARAAAHELSASAPLFGTRVTLAAGRPGDWERALLAREGLAAEAFQLGTQRVSPKGERRAVRAFAHAMAWDWAREGGEAVLRLRCELGPGVYATALLRELCKDDAPLTLPPPDAP